MLDSDSYQGYQRPECEYDMFGIEYPGEPGTSYEPVTLVEKTDKIKQNIQPAYTN